MTTTLRPIEPLQQEADGTRSRRYQVCVNSRPVGTVGLSTSAVFGDAVAHVRDLRIDEADRRRGRATVAALAAEEVARTWGCRRIEATVPADAGAALRLADALGYTVRNRNMEKRLGGPAPELPAGSRARPMTPEEFEAWRELDAVEYAREWTARGVTEEEALAKSRREQRTVLPDGIATAGMEFLVLEHEGERAGVLWLSLGAGETDPAYVYQVRTEPAVRGRGHGRTLMLLAEARAAEAGRSVVGLNVFAGNAPAERLYDSLGYRTTRHHLYKVLV
ncbi:MULTISPECIES: GNAT family N-acetyltransferase [Streptomyces]|uniref:GNAT family N-acetyltransferase n=1 Tax=Streptomyces chilikensis TaxID=1194079 RepID=A0ABV3EKX1_9ACTN|nr:GNAT family N-acetyltransferase [Streptomyces sp. MJP52]MDH6227882.1 ribosomal protein S18 acetylase RimI-like enzyme [Streptomyces sp. MJP52]